MIHEQFMSVKRLFWFCLVSGVYALGLGGWRSNIPSDFKNDEKDGPVGTVHLRLFEGAFDLEDTTVEVKSCKVNFIEGKNENDQFP